MTSLLLAFIVGISDMCMTNRYEVHRNYSDAFQAAGYDTVLIFHSTDTNALRRIVRGLDLVVLTGGADVAPERYGERNEKSWPSPERDAFDFALVAACRAEKKPMLGICRGCQLLNVAFGGTLVQDIPSMWQAQSGKAEVGHCASSWTGSATNPPAHAVTFAADSRLAKVWGTSPMPTTSYHHQCVKKTAPGFRVVARAPDGVPEAIEHETLPIFGVQFHPEIVVALKPAGHDIERHLDFFRRLPELCVAKSAESEVSPTRERRLVWGRPYQMRDSVDGTWEGLAKALKADGITDVLCCFTMGAYARYASKVMEPYPEMVEHGDTDLVTPMVKALHAEGIKLHAWMALSVLKYNLKPATKERLVREGRVAVDRDGQPCADFLCREDPRNVEMFRAAAAEMIALGVDGIHLDYIRYNHWSDCYCEHFKKAYAANGGTNLADWPKGVDGEKGLDSVWVATRVQMIDNIVKVMRAEVAKHPGVELSAAVFDPPATTGVLIGQDWPKWAREGWMDFVCPMDYMRDPEDFRRELLEEMPIAAAAKKTKIYPGLAVGWSGGENNSKTLKEELRMARAYLPGGFTIFYWGQDTKGRIDTMLRK